MSLREPLMPLLFFYHAIAEKSLVFYGIIYIIGTHKPTSWRILKRNVPIAFRPTTVKAHTNNWATREVLRWFGR